MSINTENNDIKVIKVGSRKSELALIQTKYVISRLQKLFPYLKWEIHTMTTMGDRVLNRALPKIGEKSLFTKDLEEALRIGDIDLIVHSLKDLPTQLPDGMAIGAVLERDDPRDALVLNSKFAGKTLSSLPKGSLIGTSSLRRTAQLSRKFTHLKVCDIRGNLNTRLAKLDAEQSNFSGIILANAGLKRMGWDSRINEIIEPKALMYAVGQGALAVECRANDCFVLNLLEEISDFKTQCRILSERSFLKTLGGGCSAPVGTQSEIRESKDSEKKTSTFHLDISGGVWSLNGDTEIIEELSESFELELNYKESDEESEVTPTKRQKVSEESDESTQKLSPTIIHENFLSPPESENVGSILEKHLQFNDISYTRAGQDDNNSKSEFHFDTKKIPIGQDVMAECPVVDVRTKVSGSSSTSKCPMNEGKGVGFSLDEIKSEELKKCPFFKLIDYEANAEERSKRQTKSLIENCGDVKLFCGLFCHKAAHLEAFEMCEKLGVNLAEKLVALGALEVMKKAQDEVHAK